MKHTDPPARHASAGHGATQDPSGHHHYTAEELHNEDVAHEHSDINIRAIAMFAGGLATITAAVFVLMYGLFWFFDREAASSDAQVSPVAAPTAVMPPRTTGTPTFGNAPAPRLLTNEYMALRQQREKETRQLTGYGWINEQAGIAHMPVAEAKKLIVERGLPVRANPAVDPSLGTVRPARGESSSGRLVDGPPRGAGLPTIGEATAVPHQPTPAGQQTPPQKGGN